MLTSVLARSLVPVLVLQLALPLELRAAPPEPPGPPLESFTWEAPNGFQIEVVAKPGRRGQMQGHAVLRGRDGETMTFDFLPGTALGPTVVIDRSIVLGYRVSPRGQIDEVLLHDGRGWAAAPGGPAAIPERARLYGDLAARLAAGHSPEFVSEMSAAMQVLGQETVLPADTRSIISCILGVAGYILSIWGLIAGCSPAGIVTLGSSCLLAILSHEVATASAIASCWPD